jgi:dephospho-CoA kinase
VACYRKLGTRIPSLTFLVQAVRIAITGGIASGKSSVGDLFVRHGVPVRDADAVAHALLEPGTVVYREVRSVFGEGILSPDGRIDRRALGARVFVDEAQRMRLNAIVHPPVMRELREWAFREEKQHEVVAVIIPLLCEIGDDQNWDRVICVSSTRAIQRERLALRGITLEDADKRIAAQTTDPVRMACADHVIINQTSRDILARQVDMVLARVRGIAATGWAGGITGITGRTGLATSTC